MKILLYKGKIWKVNFENNHISGENVKIFGLYFEILSLHNEKSKIEK